ncbi:hypothetical protein ACFE04_011805 [Oxalis oulophora]
MENCMIESMKKLAIWNTKTFKPIFTDEELEPIMSSLGFIPLPPTSTSKEYVYSSIYATKAALDRDQKLAAANRLRPPAPRLLGTTQQQYQHPHPHPQVPLPLPKPKLPYPRIDGLHVYTYRAFLDAVNFYLHRDNNLSDLLHIRGMPLDRTMDKCKKWRRMEQEETVYVYRDGTLDQLTYTSYTRQAPNYYDNDANGGGGGGGGGGGLNEFIIRDKGTSNNNNNNNNVGGVLIPLGDVITKL